MCQNSIGCKNLKAIIEMQFTGERSLHKMQLCRKMYLVEGPFSKDCFFVVDYCDNIGPI